MIFSSYPSGRLALLVAWGTPGQDKQEEPRIQAVVMNRVQGTCYHRNGCVWYNWFFNHFFISQSKIIIIKIYYYHLLSAEAHRI